MNTMQCQTYNSLYLNGDGITCWGYTFEWIQVEICSNECHSSELEVGSSLQSIHVCLTVILYDIEFQQGNERNQSYPSL